MTAVEQLGVISVKMTSHAMVFSAQTTDWDRWWTVRGVTAAENTAHDCLNMEMEIIRLGLPRFRRATIASSIVLISVYNHDFLRLLRVLQVGYDNDT